MKLNSNN